MTSGSLNPLLPPINPASGTKRSEVKRAINSVNFHKIISRLYLVINVRAKSLRIYFTDTENDSE